MTLDASTVQAAYDRAISRCRDAAGRVEVAERAYAEALNDYEARRNDLDHAWDALFRAELIGMGKRGPHKGDESLSPRTRWKGEKVPTRAWIEAVLRRAAEAAEDETTD